MKQDNNNEIDLLLRSLARDDRGESPLGIGKTTGREDGVLSDHLDADELNAFAEGVVPAPARARYVTHLADCGTCRATVINLTRATGAATRSENLEQLTEGGFWQKVASLFSPPVLRYAVPALALTAIMAVSFLALRQQRRPDLVAQNERTNSAAPVSLNQQQPVPFVAQSKTQAPAKTPGSTQPPAGLDSSGDKKAGQGEKSGKDRAPAEAADLDAFDGSSLKDSPPSSQGYVAGGARPVFAPEPQTAPPPPPAKPALSEADKSVAVQKEEVARREVQSQSQEEEKNQSRDETRRPGPSRSNTTPAASKRADGLMAERGEPRTKSKKDSDGAGSDDEVETRTVSGKRFRRQGSVWIDTAYNSSRRTINISRGTEQFRALVADEPGIRTVADKLDGVVIVVWNGRAYRIQ